MSIVVGDNRFEIIAKAKKDLIEGTNIETSEDEMKVLDNFLFRCWQMGWLDGCSANDVVSVIRCKDCKHKPTIDGVYENGFDIVFPDMRCPCQCEDGWYNWIPDDDWYCANAERKKEFKKRYSGETE